jgi:hypothetical protein
MSLFEEPAFQQFVSIQYESITKAQEAAGVRLSPFAEQIVLDWMSALAFEGPEPVSPLTEPDPAGLQAAADLGERLPDLLTSVDRTLGLFDRSGPRRSIITAADLYHWLTEHGEQDLAFIRWPYPKD